MKLLERLPDPALARGGEVAAMKLSYALVTLLVLVAKSTDEVPHLRGADKTSEPKDVTEAAESHQAQELEAEEPAEHEASQAGGTTRVGAPNAKVVCLQWVKCTNGFWGIFHCHGPKFCVNWG